MRLFEPGIQLHENLPTFDKVDYFSRGKIKLAMKERKFIFTDAFTGSFLFFHHGRRLNELLNLRKIVRLKRLNLAE